MSSVKKEARLSGILLARKGSALPAYTDHRLTFQAMDQMFHSGQERIIPKELTHDDVNNTNHIDRHELSNAINELKTIHKKQTSSRLNISQNESFEKTLDNKVNQQKQSSPKSSHANQAQNVMSKAPNKNVQGKRIAMTLRMEQDDHLKLRLYAAHSRKSCQEIISEALELYLSKSDKVCLMEECNCLSS